MGNDMFPYMILGNVTSDAKRWPHLAHWQDASD